MQIQITLKSDKGYKPVSTLIEVESLEDYKANKASYQKKAIVQICAKRHWTSADRLYYGYKTLMQRVYDKEKIERENAERYERIKRERGWVKDDSEEQAEARPQVEA